MSWTTQLNLNGHHMIFKMDTGADVQLLQRECIRDHKMDDQINQVEN